MLMQLLDSLAGGTIHVLGILLLELPLLRDGLASLLVVNVNAFKQVLLLSLFHDLF